MWRLRMWLLMLVYFAGIEVQSGDLQDRFTECSEALKKPFQVHDLGVPQELPLGSMCNSSNPALLHCAPDPDGFGPVTGVDMVREHQRQLCLWSFTIKDDNSSNWREVATFHKYMKELEWQCTITALDPYQRMGDLCSYWLMGHLRMDVERVRSCVHDNSLLDEQTKTMALQTPLSAGPTYVWYVNWGDGFVVQDLVRSFCAGCAGASRKRGPLRLTSIVDTSEFDGRRAVTVFTSSAAGHADETWMLSTSCRSRSTCRSAA